MPAAARSAVEAAVVARLRAAGCVFAEDEARLLVAEAREHEPRVALDGGDDGLDVARRVVAGAGAWLAPAGSLLFEVGAAQVLAATRLVGAAGLAARVATDDEVGAIVVVGTAAPD